MKLSTKGIYAIEAIVDLAVYSEDGVESIKNIAQRRNVSEKYLEQIIGAMRRAGLIQSTRGANGGYRLAKNPSEITVFQIIQAVETNLYPIECLESLSLCERHSQECAIYPMWKTLWSHIEQICRDTTVANLVEKSRQDYTTGGIEYYI